MTQDLKANLFIILAYSQMHGVAKGNRGMLRCVKEVGTQMFQSLRPSHRGRPRCWKTQLMARSVIKFLVIQLFFFTLLRAQLDHADLEALKSVKSGLQDLPGSNFLASWDFMKDPCTFAGVLCNSVNGLERVTVLNLGEAVGNTPGLRGELSNALGSLSELLQLTLVPGEVSGIIPESLGYLKNLAQVGLSKNSLSGSIPNSLGNLKQLVILDLSYNHLTGSIPGGLASLANLNSLILCHNKLTGSIPTFTSPLVHLELKQNVFWGPLPAFPSSLEYLCLANNQLSGSLANLQSLSNLGYLDLSFNQFSGSVPSAIFGFKLRSLFLQRNVLSGPINPLDLVFIPTVDLSYNKLSGEVSPFLAFVQNLYLNNNLFTGVVPQEFVDQLSSASIQTLYLQHNYLTDFRINPHISLPLACSLCIQYNCMHPPIRSPCPVHAGKQQSRPAYQCKEIP